MKVSGGYLRDGDQLRLNLFPGEPWDGQCPRVLTRRFIPLFLRPEPSVPMGSPEETGQLEIWQADRHPRRKSPLSVVSAEGASSLFDFT